jgi:hypothetical protein
VSTDAPKQFSRLPGDSLGQRHSIFMRIWRSDQSMERVGRQAPRWWLLLRKRAHQLVVLFADSISTEI